MEFLTEKSYDRFVKTFFIVTAIMIFTASVVSIFSWNATVVVVDNYFTFCLVYGSLHFFGAIGELVNDAMKLQRVEMKK